MKKWKVNLKKTMKEQDLRDKFIAEGCLFANAEKCVQIAKDYAEQESIEFAEWLHTDTTYIGGGSRRVINDNNHYTLTECYQLFKNRENER